MLFIFLAISSILICLITKKERYAWLSFVFVLLSSICLFFMPMDDKKMSDREKFEKTIIRKDGCYRQFMLLHGIGLIEIDCQTGKDKIGD
jgi:hypothetical protein